jgi:hypothetical protein
MKRSRMKPRKRSAEEFARIYGSEERVEWVKAQPCVVPGCPFRPIENAHIKNGGMGRKSDYQNIVPLCQPHHLLLHNTGKPSMWGIDLEAAAAETEAKWKLYADFHNRGTEP